MNNERSQEFTDIDVLQGVEPRGFNALSVPVPEHVPRQSLFRRTLCRHSVPAASARHCPLDLLNPMGAAKARGDSGGPSRHKVRQRSF